MTDAKKLEPTKVARSLSGRVTSDKMDKTITVLVERKVKHPLIGKVIVKSNKFHAHDEKNECKEGDLVTITETRPMSKTKTWALAKIVTKA
jgi:small subunit ribosomal protein S17